MPQTQTPTRAGFGLQILTSVVEGISAFFFQLIPISAIVLYAGHDNIDILIPLVFASTLAAIAGMTGRYASADVNVAITIARMLAGQINFVLGWVNIAFVLLFQFLAVALVRMFIPGAAAVFYGMNRLVMPDHPYAAVAVEFLGTLFLILMALVVGQHKLPNPIGPIVAGFTLFVTLLFTSPITSGGLNPGRSLACNLIAWDFTNVGYFLLPQLVASFVAFALYRVLHYEAILYTAGQQQKC